MIYKIKDSEWKDVIELDEYNGKWSLVASREGNDGKIYKKWGHYQTKDRTPSEKAIPWSVGRMEKAEMIEMLTQFISDLKQDSGDIPHTESQQVDDSDIPF